MNRISDVRHWVIRIFFLVPGLKLMPLAIDAPAPYTVAYRNDHAMSTLKKNLSRF